MILSTTCAGFKHCATLFMIGGRTRRVSYVPKYHSDWVSSHFLTEAFVTPRENSHGQSFYQSTGEVPSGHQLVLEKEKMVEQSELKFESLPGNAYLLTLTGKGENRFV